ncbi:MAG: MFS transporter [Actinomycetota bacterium]|nr:MFS transporter [Actinomycetota bacterium]
MTAAAASAGSATTTPITVEAATAADPPRRIFQSLGIRNFRLFFFGQLVSQVGTWLSQVALTLLILHLTNSGVAMGALIACQFAPVLLLGFYGGVTADRRDKRRVLLITQTLQMVQSAVLAVFAFMPHPPIAAFYVVALAGGVLLAFDNPARRSFVTEMVPLDHVQNAVMLNAALMTASRVVGPALAGLLVVTAGYGWAFTINAVSYLAVIGGLWLMRPSELRRATRTPKAKGQVRDGLRYVRNVPELWVPMVMVTIIGMLTFNFAVTLPLFVVRSLQGSDGTYTALYAVLSIGSLAAALAAARQRTSTVRTAVRAAFGFAASMFLLAAAPNLATAFPAALLVGFFSILFMTGATAMVQVNADPAMRGRVLSLQAIVILGTSPIGGPLVGAACDAFGARSGLVIGGVGALGAALWGHRQGLRARSTAGVAAVARRQRAANPSGIRLGIRNDAAREA